VCSKLIDVPGKIAKTIVESGILTKNYQTKDWVTDCNLQFVEDKKEWKNTEVVFDISSDGAATTVTMTHSGLEPGVACYETCRKGWNFFITDSLQKLLTENQGMPDRSGKRESAEEVAASTQ
jgi:hypothetical protein